MGQGSARYGVAVLILVILWIAVYWWTPAPAPEPELFFGETAIPARAQAQSAPLPTPTFARPDASRSAPINPLAGVSSDSAPSNSTPPRPTGGVVPPSFRDYSVRAGDTAQTISRRFYGTTAHWQQVMKANPRVDFTRLKAGRIIRVPVDPSNVQGVPDEGSADGSNAVAQPMMEYRVKSGDTLSEIAQTIYGRSGLWTVIRDANRAKVGADGSNLRPGMTLLIPHAPAGQ